MSFEDGNVVELIELTKIYKDFWGRPRVKALDGLNLEVKRGEVFGLLGPNGSGKTTTVRLMLGLLFPTRGAVRIFGKSPRDISIKKRIGYMPEESHLYEYLTAEETLDFFGRLFGLDSAVRRHRTDALIEMVGLQRARRRPIREFSKGMARRIGLAQSLINDPDLLILDEPTTGLDPIGAHEMKELIRTLKKRGKTIFICSHLLADVEEVCDRLCILYGGKTRSMGEVAELLTKKEVTEIRAPRLPEEVIEKLKAIIRDAKGETARVEVGFPSRRLEEFFLEVVEEARRERLATSGAEVGAAPADFLRGEEKTGDELVEELVSASREVPDGRQSTEPEPVEVAPAYGHDRALIDDLVKGARQGPSSHPAAQEEPAPAPAQAGVQHNLIEELEAAARKLPQEAEKQDEDTDEEENRKSV